VTSQDVALLNLLFPEGWSPSVVSEFAKIDGRDSDSGVYNNASKQSSPVGPRRRPTWKAIAAQLGNSRPAAQLCDRFNKVIRPLLHTAALSSLTFPNRLSSNSPFFQSSPLFPSAAELGNASPCSGQGKDGLSWTPERVRATYTGLMPS
jgi:hypothetical protein